MKILIKKRGRIIGPLTEEETVKRFDAGEFTETDLAMVEGATGWHELGSYIVEEPIKLTPKRTTNARLTEGSSSANDIPPEEAEVSDDQVPAWRNPLRLGAFSIGLGTIVMLLSAWPWLLYVPLFLVGLVAATVLVRRGYRSTGTVLFAAALLLPGFLWIRSLGVSTEGRLQSESRQTAEASSQSSTDQLPQASTASLDSNMSASGEKVAASSDQANLPSPSQTSASARSKTEPGQRVVLQRNTTLLFRNEPFRKATAGEEFIVIAYQSDTGRLFVKEKDAAGTTIAVSLPAELVASASKTALNNNTPLSPQAIASPGMPAGFDTGAREQGQGAGKPSLSMDVRPISSGGKVRSRNGAVVGQGWDFANSRQLQYQHAWSTRDRESRVGLAVQVHNFGRAPQEIRVEAYFVGSAVTGDRSPFLLSTEVENHTVQGGNRITTEVFSETARNSTNRSYSTRTNPDPNGTATRLSYAASNTGGTKVSGWIVRLLAGEQILQTRASSPSLERVAKDPAALEQLTATMRAEQKGGAD